MARSSFTTVPHRLLVIDSSAAISGVSVAVRGNSPGGCGEPSALLLCNHRVQSPDSSSPQMRSQATVSCLRTEYNGLLISCQTVDWGFQWPFSIGICDCFGAGFWLPDKWRWTGIAVVCCKTWRCDLLFHCLETHSGLRSIVGLPGYQIFVLEVLFQSCCTG